MRRLLSFAVLASGLACGGEPESPAPRADETAPAPALAPEDPAPEPAVVEPLPAVAPNPDAPAQPVGFCDQVAALTGNWTLTTSVVGARSQSAVGATADYALSVRANGCEAEATLRRVGEGGAALPAARVREARAQLSASEALGLPQAAGASFALAHGEGVEGQQVFAFFVQDERLFGYWHDAGAQWEAAGLSGVLAGAREPGKAADPGSVAAQPCAVRCAVGCDSARRRADETFVPADFDACLASCTKPDASATCGKAPGLPEARVLKLHGPRTNLGQQCNDFLDEALERIKVHSDELEYGCKSTLEYDGRESPVLKAEAFDGSFEVARFFETGHEYQGHTGEVRLALMTKAGWWVSEPLLDSSSAGLQEHRFEHLDLYPRELSDAPGRELVAVLANRVTNPDPERGLVTLDELTMTVACRAGKGEAPPHCIALRTASRHAKQKSDGASSTTLSDEKDGLDVTFLPGGRVSIGAGKGGRANNPLVGIHSW